MWPIQKYGYISGVAKRNKLDWKTTYDMIPFIWNSGRGKTTEMENYINDFQGFWKGEYLITSVHRGIFKVV